MKTIDIVIKSYSRDFNLLKYALMSIEKNVTGYQNLILLIPEDEKDLFETRFLPERTLVYYIPEKSNGYLWQQVCKVNAFKYSYADFIMFSDSDVIFDHPINVQDAIIDDKPEILYTSWDKVGDARCWRKPMEDFIKGDAPFEMMRRNNQCYHRSTLVSISNYAPDLENTIMNSTHFSEFNCMSLYAYKFEQDRYIFTNTDNWTYVPPLGVQLWSKFDKDGDEVHQKEYYRVRDVIKSVLGVEID